MNQSEIRILTEEVVSLCEKKNFSSLRDLLKEENPADIALVISELDEKDMPVVYRLLPKELASDTFVYMDSEFQELLIKSFSDRELKEVIDDLFLDDTVDIIEEMPANVVARILQNASASTRRQINELLKYPEDSAGSIMTTEYVSLRKSFTVQDAFDRIRREGINKETIYTCYVTENRRLIGLITVKELLLHSYDQKIADIMETNVIYVDVLEDKEQVSKVFSKYDINALPVVDSEQRIVGIITIDDALDVIEDEATEDIEVMAAITPNDKPYLKTNVFSIWGHRIPWLMLLMVSATFTGTIISSFEESLQLFPALIAFIPMIMDTGGNAGGQSSATVIRGLATGDIELGDVLRVIWKELRVSMLCGISLAAANFVKIILVDNLLLHSNVSIMADLVVCITLCCAVVFAKLVGSTLPILAKRIGFDPAVMASPFITTIVDAISLLVYLNIAKLILGV
ncbi:MAG: magnesium transporter [Acutalibacteraceae bacterium]